MEGKHACIHTGRHTTKDVIDSTDELKEVVATGVEPTDLISDGHVIPDMSDKFIALLTEYKDLYDGILRKLSLPDYVLPVSADFKPVHPRPFPLAKRQEESARLEIRRRVELDVLEQVYDSDVFSRILCGET